jgi:hypothetical protein
MALQVSATLAPCTFLGGELVKQNAVVMANTSAAYTQLARTRCEVGKPRRPTDAKLTGAISSIKLVHVGIGPASGTVAWSALCLSVPFTPSRKTPGYARDFTSSGVGTWTSSSKSVRYWIIAVRRSSVLASSVPGRTATACAKR